MDEGFGLYVMGSLVPSQMHMSAGSLLGIFVAFVFPPGLTPERVHTEFHDSVRT